MAKTQDILDRCADLANARFPKAGGACTARDAAIYLAHTEQGESLRALAEATGTHPSTVMRTVRRVEARRDDPLVDSMLTDMEGRTGIEGCSGMEGCTGPDDKTPPPANDNQAPVSPPPGITGNAPVRA